MTVELCQLSSGVRGGVCEERNEGKGGSFVSFPVKEDL